MFKGRKQADLELSKQFISDTQTSRLGRHRRVPHTIPEATLGGGGNASIIWQPSFLQPVTLQSQASESSSLRLHTATNHTMQGKTNTKQCYAWHQALSIVFAKLSNHLGTKNGRPGLVNHTSTLPHASHSYYKTDHLLKTQRVEQHFWISCISGEHKTSLQSPHISRTYPMSYSNF